MKMKSALILAICALVALVAGCSDSTVLPDEPASAAGVTDATGVATIPVGPYSAEVTVRTVSQSAIAGVNVACYLLHEHIVYIASSPTGTYYPAMEIASLSDAQTRRRPDPGGLPDRVNSAKVARETVLELELTMVSATYGSHGYDTTPANYDLIQSDSWTTTTTATMDMETFFQEMDTVDFVHSTFVHLNDNIALSSGAGRQLASFLLNQIPTFEAFSSLISLELRIFGGDTVEVTTLTYQNEHMPLMNISNLVMNRDFWLQFTLTWGEDPRDLDSHLFTPVIPGDFDTVAYHVYYGSSGSVTSAPYADLDVDDVTSFGPEHITIWQEFPGTYIYAIYHYSGAGTIVSSQAQVSLLEPDGTIQYINVPTDVAAGSNYWWHVCNVDGTTRAVTVVDTIAAASPGGLYLNSGEPMVMPAKESR